MVWALSPSPEADDRYLLRDLLWCGLCEVPMNAALLSTSRRFYGCTSLACPRSLIPADLSETLVWQAFRYLFADATAELTTAGQRRALVHALERVTVGVDLGDVRYQWRGRR
jgi:hypothetical protein